MTQLGAHDETPPAQVADHPDTLPPLTLRFQATAHNARSALCDLRKALMADSRLSEMTLSTVEIVLAEVTNNIVEHAYEDRGTGDVALHCEVGQGVVHFVLEDAGKPYPRGQLPEKRLHDLDQDLASLPEGGFGWGLIRDLTLSLSYDRSGGQNILSLSIKNEPA